MANFFDGGFSDHMCLDLALWLRCVPTISKCFSNSFVTANSSSYDVFSRSVFITASLLFVAHTFYGFDSHMIFHWCSIHFAHPPSNLCRNLVFSLSTLLSSVVFSR